MPEKNIADGLYETLINEELAKKLDEIRQIVKDGAWQQELLEEDTPEVLSQYAAQLVRKALLDVSEEEHFAALARHLMASIVEQIGHFRQNNGKPWQGLVPQLAGAKPTFQQLLAVQRTGAARKLARPQLPAGRTCVLTGGIAADGPQILDEIKRELASAQSADWLISFIRVSAVSPLLEAIKEFTGRGGRLRIITTTYTGATEAKAVDRLARIPNVEVHVQYEGTRCRHHAKVYVFHRNSGYGSAYVGSSNFSRSALTVGLEWNVKIAQAENPAAFDSISNHFDLCWQNIADFQPYDPARDYQKLEAALCQEKYPAGTKDRPKTFVFDIRPFYYQEEILDKLKALRTAGESKALVVAATGTGKTVIAAFDYARIAQKAQASPHLLFVAHREEILKQALQTYRGILRQPNFGELFVGSRPRPQGTAVFASVQSLTANHAWESWPRDFFDVMVVDEAHHVAADTYQRLLSWFSPKWLLGMTATALRADGSSVAGSFNGRIAAQVQLADAVDKGLLAPFHYFVVTDPANLQHIAFRNGSYDDRELEQLYTQGWQAQNRVNAILQAVDQYLPAKEKLRCLAFCATKQHAQWMSEQFVRAGYQATCITGESASAVRQGVREGLERGELQIVCCVDVYNEGVDLPNINALLFLRPTKSLTIFLQQLGRGLRRYPDKDVCFVLDFVAPANRLFSFESRLRSLLRSGGGSLTKQIEQGSLYLPAGCSITFERVAQESVLANIRENAEGIRALRLRLQWYCQEHGKTPCLREFLADAALDAASFYRQMPTVGSFFGFLESVHERSLPEGPRWAVKPKDLAAGLANLALLEDAATCGALRKALIEEKAPDDALGRSRLRLLAAALGRKFSGGDDASRTLFSSILAMPWLKTEICDLLALLSENQDQQPEDWGFDCPLQVRGVYTRDEILSVLQPTYRGGCQSGCWYIPDHRLDVLFVTVNKSEKWFHSNVRYEDYALTETRFHWQSQHTTAADSSAGRRYQSISSFASEQNRAVLFVRARKLLPATTNASPYMCLGFVRYIRHQGSRPMSIEWELQHALTARSKRECMVVSSG